MNRLKHFSNLLKHFLHPLSPHTIAVYGSILMLSVLLLLHTVIFLPIDRAALNLAEDLTSIQQENNRLEALDQQRKESIPFSSDMPFILNEIKEYLHGYQVTTKEIVINHLPPIGETKQSVIKLSVMGEHHLILQALAEIQDLHSYPLLVEELKMTEKQTEINLKILTQ